MTIRPFILGIAGLELTDNEQAIFKDNAPAGIILFLRNVDNPDQLRKLNDQIHALSNGQTKVYIDQEGGRVQRLAPPYWDRYPIGRNFDHLDGDDFAKAIYAHHRLIGDDLYAMGFDVNCAPCLDLRCSITADFLQDRSFGGDVARLVTVANEAKRGLMDSGVFPVAKHIPGHGRGQVDSHKSLPVVEFDTDPYQAPMPKDAQVFAAISNYPFGMSAHILYPQIDKELPLTLSSKGFDYIRKNLRFNGIMLSDDLDMKALNGTQAELAKQCLDAGADLALSCSGEFDHIRQLCESDLQMHADLEARLDKLFGSLNDIKALTKAERTEYKKLLPAI